MRRKPLSLQGFPQAPKVSASAGSRHGRHVSYGPLRYTVLLQFVTVFLNEALKPLSRRQVLYIQ
jgi:hypothetical protein